MSTIDVYAFEDEDDESATDWTTMDFAEAQLYAIRNGYSIIAREYEYSDSSLVEDYRPGHNLDGTKIEGGEEPPQHNHLGGPYMCAFDGCPLNFASRVAAAQAKTVAGM